jgi:hypothetical protein
MLSGQKFLFIRLDTLSLFPNFSNFPSRFPSFFSFFPSIYLANISLESKILLVDLIENFVIQIIVANWNKNVRKRIFHYMVKGALEVGGVYSI